MRLSGLHSIFLNAIYPKETNIEIAKEYEPLLTGKIIDSAKGSDAGLYLMIGLRALWLDIMPHQFSVSCRIDYSCGGFLYP